MDVPAIFEQYPWVLVVVIIVTVEVWNLLKSFVRQQMMNRDNPKRM